MQVLESKLDQVIDRFDQVEARLGAASDPEEIVRLSKEHAELKKVADKARELKEARTSLAEAEEILEDGSDPDMVALAREERMELRERIPGLEQELQLLLLPKDKDDAASVMLEIRAGTGGDEAALFAGDLFRMYERYAAEHGWSVEGAGGGAAAAERRGSRAGLGRARGTGGRGAVPRGQAQALRKRDASPCRQ